MKQVILVAATEFEILPFIAFAEQHLGRFADRVYVYGDRLIHILVTGVGSPQTTYSLTKYLASWEYHAREKPDLVLQAGVAGAFNRQLVLGEVVEVIAETWGDLGVTEADGAFTDVFEMKLIDGDSLPYSGGKLLQPGHVYDLACPLVQGLTVNCVSGEVGAIQALREKYSCDIESMEGAAFFMVCLREKVPFCSIRAISNYVEPRNRAGWQLEKAIDRLNAQLVAFLCPTLTS